MSDRVDRKREIAARWDLTRAEIEATPLPASLGELVDRSEALYGDAPAWNFFEIGQKASFREAATRSRQAANALAALGVTRGDRVALMVGNTVDYLATFFGLARLGACIVPVNGRYTARELTHVLTLAESKVLVVGAEGQRLVDADTQHLFRELVPTILTAEEWSARIDASDVEFTADPAVSQDDIVSVQFTSGTTGFPKGCLLPQMYWITAAVGWQGYVDRPISRSLCNQMLFYIDGTFNAVTSFYRGAEFYCSSKPSGSRFLEWVREFRINTTYYFDPLFKQPETEYDADNELEVLHFFGFNRRNHAALEKRFGAIARDSFGMSECAPVLMMPLDADVLVGEGSAGLPAPWVEVRLIDEHGDDVPQGDAGELIFRSPGMMHGYIGDPEATARTIKNGWLYTGDLGRQDEAGFFYIVGRTKDMIRRNSENVASVEVESVLRLIPEVADAAVVAVPDDVVGEEVKAYLQLRDGADVLDPTAVLEFCREHLAKFKVPRYLEFVETFPLTESLRVEKKKLIAGVDDLTAGAYDAVAGRWNV